MFHRSCQGNTEIPTSVLIRSELICARGTTITGWVDVAYEHIFHIRAETITHTKLNQTNLGQPTTVEASHVMSGFSCLTETHGNQHLSQKLGGPRETKQTS